MSLRGKRIVVGVGGGIAAFKAVHLVRELIRRGASVRVAMTPSGARFVGPVTFAGITGHPTVVDLWDPSYDGEVHVELGDWADAVVVAPATANLLSRAAHGMADDAVLATLLCASVPVLFAPAMHTRMWERDSTRRNVTRLADDGALFVGPVVGELASGDTGNGRMSEPESIADAVDALFSAGADLADRRILVTAGPTHEDLDPVRYLGNRSSGRMGWALAERAAARGASTILISGPVNLPPPPGVETVRVRSAVEMHDAVMERLGGTDAVVMAAAVADYRPVERADDKIKKGDGPMTLSLVRNPDILAALGQKRTGRRPVLVGFALESTNLVPAARAKLEKKRVDVVVANDAAIAFGGDENEATIVQADGEEALPPMSKHALAERVLDRVRDLLDGVD